jgi:hypothetical protein
MRVKTKTKKAQKKKELNQQYHEEILPLVLARDPKCKRCNEKPSVIGHHRKGRDGKQDGVDLTIYAPLIMGVCTDCHIHIHKNPEESYREHWMYHRNRGELPKDWQDYDYVLHPELKDQKYDLSDVNLGTPDQLAAFNDFLEDSK